MSEIKIEFLKWIKNSTSHGLPHVFNKEKPIIFRLFWLVLFICSTTICFFSILKSFQNYLEYEALIKVEIEKDIQSQFPTISICNLNQYSTNISVDFVKSIMLSENISFSSVNSDNYLDLINKIDYLVKSRLIKNTDELKKSMSFPLKNMMTSCLFAARHCSYNDFEWFYSNNYGNCYRYNFNESEKIIQTRSGKFYGLRLELFVGEPDTLYSLASVSGIHIFVTNKSNEYILNGFDIATGVSTDLSFTRQSLYRLAEPYSNCISNNIGNTVLSDYSKKCFDLFNEYKREACIDFCLQDYLETKCNCYSITYPRFKLNVQCSTLEKLNCIEKYSFDFFNNNDLVKECDEKCPFKCEQSDFMYQVSFSDYPSKAYASGLMRNKHFLEKFNSNETINYDKLKSNLLSLNIFYSSFDLFKITEVESSSLIDFISSIGGTLGLYIGISLLSFFEIGEILLIIFLIIIRKNNLKTSAKS